MKRPSVCHYRFRQKLLVLLGVLLASAHLTRAQSFLPGRFLWNYELQVGPQVTRPDFQDFYQLAQLSPTRLVAVGWDGKDPNDERPLLMFINAAGDTTCRRLRELHPFLRVFERVVANPDKSFITFSGSSSDSAGRSGVLLWKFDSLGNPGWNRAIEFHDVNGRMGGISGGYPIRLPDGYLLTADYTSISAAAGYPSTGCVIKTDLRGNVQWVKWGDVYEWFYSYSQAPIGICPNGSYVVVSTSVSNTPPPVNVWDRDWHLWRVLPSGDTLNPTYFGHKRTLERSFGLAATTDNGVIVSGDRTVYAPQPQRRPVAYAVKFDSLFRMQWQVRRPPNHPPGGAAFQSVYPLSNGHYLATGYTAVLNAGSTTAYHYEGLYAEIAPPASPADTVGVIIGEWLVPLGNAELILPHPSDSTAYVYGGGQQNIDGRSYFGKITGLVPPLELNLCARPPRLLAPPVWQPINGQPDFLRFTLDALTTLAGPLYGAVSRVEWDLGDGSPPKKAGRSTTATPPPRRSASACA